MSWTWIALLIEILGVIAVFVLVFLIARSLIRYANSLKKGDVLQSRRRRIKNVTISPEVKMRIINALAEHLIPLVNRTFVVRPRGGGSVSVALFRLEPWIRM